MLQTVVEEPRGESGQTESTCRDGNVTSSKHKGNDSKGKTREKDKAKSSSASEKPTGRGEDASSRYRGSSGNAAKGVLGHGKGERAEDGD